jgi:hypothetical protein
VLDKICAPPTCNRISQLLLHYIGSRGEQSAEGVLMQGNVLHQAMGQCNTFSANGKIISGNVIDGSVYVKCALSQCKVFE